MFLVGPVILHMYYKGNHSFFRVSERQYFPFVSKLITNGKILHIVSLRELIVKYMFSVWFKFPSALKKSVYLTFPLKNFICVKKKM